MNKEDLIFKMIMDEISGKIQAVHAYDKMVWTIRSGFLTLFFAGWGIIVKSIVDNSSDIQRILHPVLIAMILVSISFSIGGFVIDQSYVKRKFRVIHALDNIMLLMMQKNIQILSDTSDICNYIQVSGDKDDRLYLEVSGYRPERRAELVIYAIPIIMVTVSVKLIW